MNAQAFRSENEQLLAAALDIGEQLLECGGEVSRVEDTIQRICTSYGAERADVFAITSSIVVSMQRGMDTITQTRRISKTDTNFSRLEALNELSRYICREKPDISALPQKLKAVSGKEKKDIFFSPCGYMLAAGAYAIFFGGNLQDGLCAAICGVPILFLNQWFQRIWNSRLLHALFCSIFAGAAALVLNRWGLCEHADKVIIGDIMLLIPGIALTNALRDLFAGDTISGLLRLLEALLQAGAIACGFALSVYLGGILL